MPKALYVLTLLMISLAAGASSPVAGGSDLILSFPLAHEDQRFVYLDQKSHFHLLVTNKSDRPQRMWLDSNSWGYRSISFELTDASGKTYRVARKDTVFTRNIPSYWTIASGDTLVTDVYFGDLSLWDGFPLRKGQSTTVRLRAVLDVPASPESAQLGVWTGRVESDEIEATFVR